jgi:hypothetical protein
MVESEKANRNIPKEENMRNDLASLQPSLVVTKSVP